MSRPERGSCLKRCLEYLLDIAPGSLPDLDSPTWYQRLNVHLAARLGVVLLLVEHPGTRTYFHPGVPFVLWAEDQTGADHAVVVVAVQAQHDKGRLSVVYDPAGTSVLPGPARFFGFVVKQSGGRR